MRIMTTENVQEKISYVEDVALNSSSGDHIQRKEFGRRGYGGGGTGDRRNRAGKRTIRYVSYAIRFSVQIQYIVLYLYTLPETRF